MMLSFTDFDSVNFPGWVGLKNYITLFTSDAVFMQYVVPNTLKFSLGKHHGKPNRNHDKGQKQNQIWRQKQIRRSRFSFLFISFTHYAPPNYLSIRLTESDSSSPPHYPLLAFRRDPGAFRDANAAVVWRHVYVEYGQCGGLCGAAYCG